MACKFPLHSESIRRRAWNLKHSIRFVAGEAELLGWTGGRSSNSTASSSGVEIFPTEWGAGTEASPVTPARNGNEKARTWT